MTYSLSNPKPCERYRHRHGYDPPEHAGSLTGCCRIAVPQYYHSDQSFISPSLTTFRFHHQHHQRRAVPSCYGAINLSGQSALTCPEWDNCVRDAETAVSQDPGSLSRAFSQCKAPRPSQPTSRSETTSKEWWTHYLYLLPRQERHSEFAVEGWHEAKA